MRGLKYLPNDICPERMVVRAIKLRQECPEPLHQRRIKIEVWTLEPAGIELPNDTVEQRPEVIND